MLRNHYLRLLLLILFFLAVVPVIQAGDNSVLFKAVMENKVEDVRAILQREPKMSRSVSKGGMTPLHLAAARGFTDIAVILLDSGADVNARTINDSTPLSFAVVNNHLDIVDILRQRGGIE